MRIFDRKGLNWLLIATVAELPPAVSLAMLLHPIFAHHYFTRIIGIHVSEFKW